jgi:hypothetical protein
MVDAKDIKLALVAVVKQALKQGYPKTSKTVKDHVDYANILHKANNPDRYIRYVAKKLFPNESAYNRKNDYFLKYYKGDLLIKLKELYGLYYELAREEAEIVKKAITDAEANELADELLEFTIDDE